VAKVNATWSARCLCNGDCTVVTTLNRILREESVPPMGTFPQEAAFELLQQKVRRRPEVPRKKSQQGAGP
jgi:hypothetical protein